MERIESDVRQELARFGPAGAIADLVSRWPGVVGEVVARNAWPARLARDGTLHVATSSSAWAFELGQLERELLARLRDAVPEAAPTRLRFAPGPLPEPAAPEASAAGSKRPEPGPRERAAATELTKELEDGELRALLARAAAANLAKRV